MKIFYLNNRFYIHALLLTLLFVGNCFAGFVTYISFSIFALLVLFDSLGNGISYIMFALPFCMIGPYASLIFFIASIVLYVIKFYLIYFLKDKGKLSWLEIISLCLFFLYAVMPIGPYNFSKLLKIAILLFILAGLIGMSKKFSTFNIKFNIKVLAVSLILSCLLGLFWFVSPYLKTFITYDTSLIRYQGLLSQTNLLGMICAVTLSILAYQIITNKRAWLDGVLFIGVAACGISTFSKNFLILFTVILIFLFFFMMLKNWKLTLPVAVVLLALGVAAYFIKPDFFQTYINRFVGSLNSASSFEEIMNTVTTGRWNLWKGTLSYLGSHPLALVFGRGLGAGFVDGLNYSAHNAYISIIEQLGLVGALLFLFPLLVSLRGIFKNIKVSKAIILPIFVIALLLMVEDTVFFMFFSKTL